MQVRLQSSTRVHLVCGGEGVRTYRCEAGHSGGYVAVSDGPGVSRGGLKNAPGRNIMRLMSLQYSQLHSHLVFTV